MVLSQEEMDGDTLTTRLESRKSMRKLSDVECGHCRHLRLRKGTKVIKREERIVRAPFKYAKEQKMEYTNFKQLHKRRYAGK